MSGPHICAVCGKEFISGWTDGEALREYRDRFPTDGDNTAVLCDQCYEEFLDWLAGARYARRPIIDTPPL